MAKAVLHSQAENFPAWYQDVVARAELAENGPARGTMVIRPWGYAIWELMRAEMDRRITATGAENAAFPYFDELTHRIGDGGLFLAAWSGTEQSERALGENTSATIRCIIDADPPAPTCLITGQPAKQTVLICRAY